MSPISHTQFYADHANFEAPASSVLLWPFLKARDSDDTAPPTNRSLPSCFFLCGWDPSSSVGDFVSSWMSILFGASDPDPPPSIHDLINEQLNERQFYDTVREHLICFLLFLSLCIFSHYILRKYKMHSSFDSLFSGEEDYFVYRISLWMCTVSMAVSVGSAILMPFSVLGSELLQRYPGSYYLQWLSWSLIHSLWNYVFVLVNLSLFVLLPFSYFFLESQGFSFSKKKTVQDYNPVFNSILGRLYETLAVCALLIVVLLCLCDVIYNLLIASSSNLSILHLFSIFSITSVNLPLIYSCVSLIGVLLLLISTPVGFSRMFTIVSEKAQVRRGVPIEDDEQQVINRLELCCQKTREARERRTRSDPTRRSYVGGYSSTDCVPYLRSSPVKLNCRPGQEYSSTKYSERLVDLPHAHSYDSYGGFVSEILVTEHDSSLGSTFRSSLPSLPLREKSIRWYQRLLSAIKYPACVLCLLFLTSVSVLMVGINTLKLFFGYKALPAYVQYMEVQSRHTFGMVGVVLEMIIILYVMATSLVGFYSLPLVKSIRPRREKTSMTAVIVNCSCIVVLSSALPVVAVTLGITSFDLLGAYGSLRWLDNFRLVIFYNVAFAGVTVFILAKQFTSHVFREMTNRLFCGRAGSGITDDDKLIEKLE